jgi:CRP-like cAMP-binding protein
VPEQSAGAVPDIGTVERLVAMRSFPGAAELRASELSVLASVARPRRLASGEVLAREGRPLPGISVVLEGEVVVSSLGETIETARAGRVIGLIRALARDPRGLECRACSEALVLQIAIEDLEDVFEEAPVVLARVIAHVARYALELSVLHESRHPAPRIRAGSLPARPLDLVERILMLRRCPAFAGASIDAIAALAEVAREARAPAGGALWRLGTEPAALFVIVAGELDVLVASGASATLRDGDLAGAPEVLAGAAHPSDAVAREPVIALAFARDALLDLREDHTDLGLELLRDASAALVGRAGAPT